MIVIVEKKYMRITEEKIEMTMAVRSIDADRRTTVRCGWVASSSSPSSSSATRLAFASSSVCSNHGTALLTDADPSYGDTELLFDEGDVVARVLGQRVERTHRFGRRHPARQGHVLDLR